MTAAARANGWCATCRAEFVQSNAPGPQTCTWCQAPVEPAQPIALASMRRALEVTTLFHLRVETSLTP